MNHRLKYIYPVSTIHEIYIEYVNIHRFRAEREWPRDRLASTKRGTKTGLNHDATVESNAGAQKQFR